MMLHAANASRAKTGMMIHAVRRRFPTPILCSSPRRVILMAPGETHDQLLARVAMADRAAFQVLFLHFGPRLKSYLMKLGAPPGMAEELAQEAMLMVWRKARLFDPAKASAATWIFTIARNLRIDAHRRARMPALDVAETMDPGIAADDGMEIQESERRLRAALAELPPEQAEIVALSFFSDQPHSQIADALGIPLGTVKSRLRLAMIRLRAAMGEER